MNMHYKPDSVVVVDQQAWWHGIADAVSTFFRRMSNRENIVMGAPWPAPSRRRK
ncbi:hypothetical protein [Mesorhizobium xinjiangense]|uniref:hypothetical protein n=1 Tax=Mesorhizobium xinjiangense TaxID=2678685 RepID=UPI0012EECBEC|nr:hypothetical protein [Mesorhizobium xinjiangense]